MQKNIHIRVCVFILFNFVEGLRLFLLAITSFNTLLVLHPLLVKVGYVFHNKILRDQQKSISITVTHSL